MGKNCAHNLLWPLYCGQNSGLSKSKLAKKVQARRTSPTWYWSLLKLDEQRRNLVALADYNRKIVVPSSFFLTMGALMMSIILHEEFLLCYTPCGKQRRPRTRRDNMSEIALDSQYLKGQYQGILAGTLHHFGLNCRSRRETIISNAVRRQGNLSAAIELSKLEGKELDNEKIGQMKVK